MQVLSDPLRTLRSAVRCSCLCTRSHAGPVAWHSAVGYDTACHAAACAARSPNLTQPMRMFFINCAAMHCPAC